MKIDKQKAVAFTGNRKLNAPQGARVSNLKFEVYKRTYALIEEAYNDGKRQFLSGMAQGFDMIAAEAVLKLRDEYDDVELIAVIPFEGQADNFSYEDQKRYDRILDEADQIIVTSPTYSGAKVYFVRNNYLADNASYIIAYSDGNGRGTAYTLERAIERGAKSCNIFESLK
ncbi:MAG: SLOG family protein [Rikenellaceae bacterium]